MSDLIVSPKTDVNLRQENQDAFGSYDTPYGPLYVIADGMGGTQGGLIAARLAVVKFPEQMSKAHETGLDIEAALRATTKTINNEIFKIGQTDKHRDAGTTLVFAVNTPNGWILGHLGDSRAYLVSSEGLRPLTQDHTLVGELKSEGVISAEQARNHPQRSILSKAVGSEPDQEPDILANPIFLAPGQALLLCSDGLSGFATDSEIAKCLSQLADKSLAGDRLVSLAKEKGSDDNITVIYIHKPDHPEKRQPSTPSARPAFSAPTKGQPKPLTRFLPLLLLILAALGFTLYHYRSDIEPKPEEPAPVPEMPVTEVDYSQDYSLEITPCKTSLVQTAKTILGGFERELRNSLSISNEEEMMIGRQTFAEVEQRYPGKIDNDPDWVAYLNTLGATITAATSRKGLFYQFHYIDDPLENAFALPGGHVLIFRGLLENKVLNEAQLYFILAHEVCHIDARHSIAFTQLIKDLPEVSKGAGNIIDYFLNFPFSLSREQEADTFALSQTVRAGYSPFQAIKMMEDRAELGLSEPSGGLLEELEDLLGTHPPDAHRACALTNQTARLLQASTAETYYVGTSNFQFKVTREEETF